MCVYIYIKLALLGIRKVNILQDHEDFQIWAYMSEHVHIQYTCAHVKTEMCVYVF